MADDERVRRLLDELLDSHASPDDVCESCPELLPIVRHRWRQMQRLRADLDALFPSTGDLTPYPPEDAAPPRIPGYEVEAVLGRGGMGVVFKARHLRLNRTVAIKTLLGGSAGRRERQRFQREAEAVAALRHPNVVQLYDVGEEEGRPYFTMEFVEGGSLAVKLAGSPQPARPSAELVGTLAEAVQAAHRSGIIHRDLKPANVLLAADGTPKISDFGLARRLEGEAALTLSGVPVGTPSYMAPEQALGRAEAVGPATDVYALGAILYELLTGRPPFRAPTAAETVQQVISQEPAPPSRLNDRVPRDLETICLKCLHKEPTRRYANASELSDDLRRFREGRPIQARPVGWPERSLRWIRRNPAAAGLLATVLALVGLATGVGMWQVQQRADRRAEAAQRDKELRREVDLALAQAAGLRKEFYFDEARNLLRRLRQRLDPAGAEDLLRRLDSDLSDVDLAEHLDALRTRAATVAFKRDPVEIEPQYASAFTEAGLGRQGDDSASVAAAVRKSGVSADIIAALDDWASITHDPVRRTWLLSVARAADPDLARNRLRDPELWQDGARLTRLIQELNATELTPQLATALGRVARQKDADAVALMKAAQSRSPQDFWLNMELVYVFFKQSKHDEALQYCQAAVAVRPKSSEGHCSFGMVLHAAGRLNDAMRQYQEAVLLDRTNARAHERLAAILRDTGQIDEAIAHLEEILASDPKSFDYHANLASALQARGRVDEAIGHFRQAIDIEPRFTLGRLGLASALEAKGRFDDAIACLKQAVSIDPNSTIAHNDLGLLLTSKGRVDEAIGHYLQALRIEPGGAMLHHNLGHALHTKGRVDDALDHCREAVRLAPEVALFHQSLAVIQLGNGRPEEAIEHAQRALRLDPKHVGALESLGAAYHDSACAALQHASAQRSENEHLGEPERAALRQKAMDWLRADVELAARLQRDGPVIESPLAAWPTDLALAAIREPAELAKLPDAERDKWQRLWADVAAAVDRDPLEHARKFAARRDWGQAAGSYATAVERGTKEEGHCRFEHAAVLLLAGDRAGYVEACSRMIERSAKGGSLRTYHIARACTLAPDAVADSSLPGTLADAELHRSDEQFWSLTERGALAYRSNRFHEAVSLFEQSLRANDRPGAAVVNWLWLALAKERLGHSEEARRWLSKSQAWLDQYADGMPAGAEAELGLHLHNWLEAHILRREVEALIPSAALGEDGNGGAHAAPSK